MLFNARMITPKTISGIIPQKLKNIKTIIINKNKALIKQAKNTTGKGQK